MKCGYATDQRTMPELCLTLVQSAPDSVCSKPKENDMKALAIATAVALGFSTASLAKAADVRVGPSARLGLSLSYDDGPYYVYPPGRCFLRQLWQAKSS